MIRIPNTILYILFVISLSLSISYFSEATEKIKSMNIIYKLIALAISNIGLSFLFFNNLYLDFEKRNTKNKFEIILLKKIMPLSILIISVVYLGYLNYSTVNYGFSKGKELFYQVFSFILLLSLIIYLIFEFKKKKIFLTF